MYLPFIAVCRVCLVVTILTTLCSIVHRLLYLILKIHVYIYTHILLQYFTNELENY